MRSSLQPISQGFQRRSLCKMTVQTVSYASRAANASQSSNFSTTSPDEASTFQRHRASSDNEDEQLYVLTLLTDAEHHNYMTQIRNQYFPPKINKLEAHVTMFHALPESKMDHAILPALNKIAQATQPYRIRANEAFRLSKGVGVSILDDIDHADTGKQKRNMTRIIHAELRKNWSEWLSEQDSKPPRLHYTVMNKVSDEKQIEGALHELQKRFPARVEDEPRIESAVNGLTLWEYKRSGHWANPKHFKFGKNAS